MELIGDDHDPAHWSSAGTTGQPLASDLVPTLGPTGRVCPGGEEERAVSSIARTSLERRFRSRRPRVEDERTPADAPPWQRADTIAAAALAVLLAVLFLATASYGPAQVNDTRAASIGAWSLGTRGSAVLPEGWPPSLNYWGIEGPDDRVLVNRFPGVAYWATPAYAVVDLARDEEPPTHPFLVSAAPASATAAVTAAAVAVVLLVLLRGLTTRPVAVTGALVTATGTSLWSVAADAMWPHAPAMLALTGMLLAWRRQRPALAALCAAAAVLVRPHLIVVAVVLAVFAWRHERSRDAVALTLGALAGLLTLSLYSWWAVGTLLPVAGYDAGAHLGGLVRHSPWQTIRGVGLALGSPSHGLLVFSPVVIAALVAVARSWRRLPTWTLISALAGALYLVVQVRAVGHRGGEDFFAYRVSLEALLLAAPALVLAVAEVVRRSRWHAAAVVILALVSVGIHGYGAVAGGISADTVRAWERIDADVRGEDTPERG